MFHKVIPMYAFSKQLHDVTWILTITYIYIYILYIYIFWWLSSLTILWAKVVTLPKGSILMWTSHVCWLVEPGTRSCSSASLAARRKEICSVDWKRSRSSKDTGPPAKKPQTENQGLRSSKQKWKGVEMCCVKICYVEVQPQLEFSFCGYIYIYVCYSIQYLKLWMSSVRGCPLCWPRVPNSCWGVILILKNGWFATPKLIRK